MPDDDYQRPPVSPDPDEVYLHYLETCRRLGVKPVGHKRARKMISGWTKILDEAVRRDYDPRRLH